MLPPIGVFELELGTFVVEAGIFIGPDWGFFLRNLLAGGF